MTEHINPGDLVFFYVTKKREFRGPYKIVDRGYYDPDHQAVEKWKSPRKQVRYEYIIPLERLVNRDLRIPLEKVFDKLLFITNKKGFKKRSFRGVRGGYTDHFQFSIISIRKEDFDTLLQFVFEKEQDLLKKLFAELKDQN